jgi:hypothetical protein
MRHRPCQGGTRRAGVVRRAVGRRLSRCWPTGCSTTQEHRRVLDQRPTCSRSAAPCRDESESEGGEFPALRCRVTAAESTTERSASRVLGYRWSATSPAPRHRCREPSRPPPRPRSSCSRGQWWCRDHLAGGCRPPCRRRTAGRRAARAVWPASGQLMCQTGRLGTYHRQPLRKGRAESCVDLR